jgi:hypothetical protein
MALFFPGLQLCHESIVSLQELCQSDSKLMRFKNKDKHPDKKDIPGNLKADFFCIKIKK